MPSSTVTSPLLGRRLTELEGHDEFTARHIGPEPRRPAGHAGHAGPGVADRADRPGGAGRHPRRPRAGPAPRPGRGRDPGPAADAGRSQPGADLADRTGLLRHRHPDGDPAQRAREPGLVHGLHALPARDLPGPARGAAQLPDHGLRPDRHGAGQRLPARRGHRRGRGHGHVPPAQPQGRLGVRGRRGLPSPDAGRGGHPGPAPGPGGGHPGRRPADRGRRPARPGPSACWPSTPAPAGWSATTPQLDRGGPRGGRPGHRGRRPARPGPAAPARARSAPTSWSARRSASGCPWASAAPTPATSPPATPTSARCRAAWWGCRWTTPGARPTASRCRPASSTSAGRRPPATSAPPRCCWPSWPACTPPTTAPTGWPASPARVHRLTAILAAGLDDSDVRGGRRPLLRHHHGRGCRAGPRRCWPRPASAGSTCARSTPTPSASAWTRPPPATWSSRCGPRSGCTASVDELDATAAAPSPRTSRPTWCASRRS